MAYAFQFFYFISCTTSSWGQRNPWDSCKYLGCCPKTCWARLQASLSLGPTLARMEYSHGFWAEAGSRWPQTHPSRVLRDKNIHEPQVFSYASLYHSVQSLSHVRPLATKWTAAGQASPSITNSRNPPRPMSIESVMPSNHLTLCHPLLLLPSIFPNARVLYHWAALKNQKFKDKRGSTVWL